MIPYLSIWQTALIGFALTGSGLFLRARIIQTTVFNVHVPTIRNDMRTIGLRMIGFSITVCGLFLLSGIASLAAVEMEIERTESAHLILHQGIYVALGNVCVWVLLVCLEEWGISLYENHSRASYGALDPEATGTVHFYVSTKEQTADDQGSIDPDKLKGRLREFLESFQVQNPDDLEAMDDFAFVGLAYDPDHVLEFSKYRHEEAFTLSLHLDDNPSVVFFAKRKPIELELGGVGLDLAAALGRAFMECTREDFVRLFKSEGAGRP